MIAIPIQLSPYSPRGHWLQVVLTNEMSTRLGLSRGTIVGSLGDAWAHRCNTRLLLCHMHGQRTALLLKRINAVNTVGTFKVCSYFPDHHSYSVHPTLHYQYTKPSFD